MTHTFKCPNCTAPLEVEESNVLAVRCNYCGMSAPIPEALRRRTISRRGFSDAAVAQIAKGRDAEAIALIRRAVGVGHAEATALLVAMKTGDAAQLDHLLSSLQQYAASGVAARTSQPTGCPTVMFMLASIGVATVIALYSLDIDLVKMVTDKLPSTISKRIESAADTAAQVISPPFADLSFQRNAVLAPNDDGQQPDVLGIASSSKDGKSLLVYIDTISNAVRWRSEADGQSRFIVTNDVIYVAAKSRLRALDRASGAAIWETSLSDEVNVSCDACIYATATRIFVLSNDAELQAFDTASGRKVWSERLSTITPRIALWKNRIVVIDRDEAASPAAAQVRVFGDDGTNSSRFSLNCTTPRTENSGGGEQLAEPYDALWVDTEAGALYAWYGGFSSCVQKYSLTSGTLQWSAQSDAEAEDNDETQFLRSGNTIIIAGNRTVLSVNALAGTTKVLHTVDKDHDELYVYGEADGALLVRVTKTRGTRRQELEAIDAATGLIRWTMPIEENGGPFDDRSGYTGLLSNSEAQTAWTAHVSNSGAHLLRITSKPFRFVFEDIDMVSGVTRGKIEAPVAGRPLLLGPVLIGWSGDVAWVQQSSSYVALDVAAKKIVAQINP